jgi:hypothetical protein
MSYIISYYISYHITIYSCLLNTSVNFWRFANEEAIFKGLTIIIRSVWAVLYRVNYVDSNFWLHDGLFSHRSYHRPNRMTSFFFRTTLMLRCWDVLYELTKLLRDTGSQPEKMETSTVQMLKPKNSHKEI